jgi:hypothetical protein
MRGKKIGTLCARDRRNKTGCVGISIVRTRITSSGRLCRFFAVHLGVRGNRKFNIDTLGRNEAWRRALQLRAEHEKKTLNVQRSTSNIEPGKAAA